MRTIRACTALVIAAVLGAPAHGLAFVEIERVGSVSAQPPAAEPGTANSGTTQPPAPAKEPTPEDLIREMEKRAADTSQPAATPSPAPSPSSPSSNAGAPGSSAPGAATPSGGAPTVKGASGRVKTRPRVISPRSSVREGTFIPARRGRVIRGPEGEWLFSFDVDADGTADAPMVLMPCQNLMAIERLAERNGESATFTLSGQVFVYHSTTYLLPTTYTINRVSDVTPGQ